MRVTVRAAGAAPTVLGAGEMLLFGRAPEPAQPDADPGSQLRVTWLTLIRSGSNVSRLLGELVVGDETARLRWFGQPSAQLSSLFEAPGGARRVTLREGMTAMLDAGENQLLILRGRSDGGGYADLSIVIDIDLVDPTAPYPPPAGTVSGWRQIVTSPLPGLEPGSDVWYVALALAEPWLSGADDYPRPPTNREISERIVVWRGDAGRLAAPQRVHDAIQQIATLAFGAGGHPFRTTNGRRVENARYAVGRRAAEVGLVTLEQLEAVERGARQRPPRAADD